MPRLSLQPIKKQVEAAFANRPELQQPNAYWQHPPPTFDPLPDFVSAKPNLKKVTLLPFHVVGWFTHPLHHPSVSVMLRRVVWLVCQLHHVYAFLGPVWHLCQLNHPIRISISRLVAVPFRSRPCATCTFIVLCCLLPALTSTLNYAGRMALAPRQPKCSTYGNDHTASRETGAPSHYSDLRSRQLCINSLSWYLDTTLAVLPGPSPSSITWTLSEMDAYQASIMVKLWHACHAGYRTVEIRVYVSSVSLMSTPT